jgi:uncharacterized phage infection (PIP) family protein YhgE
MFGDDVREHASEKAADAIEALQAERTKYRNEYSTSHAALQLVKEERDTLAAKLAALEMQFEETHEKMVDNYEAWLKAHTENQQLRTLIGASAGAQAQPLTKEAKAAVSLAYGYLWHVNMEPMAPVPMYSPEKAATEARKQLRDLLTHEERGQAINQVQHILGGSV